MKSMSMTRRMLGGKMAERYHVSVERQVGLQNSIIPVVIAQNKWVERSRYVELVHTELSRCLKSVCVD